MQIKLHFLPDENYMDKVISLVKKEQKGGIVYLTFNRPAISIIELMKKSGIDTKKVFFIDTVTPQSKSPEGNCVCIGSPTALTKIGLQASTSMEGNFSCLFFDSISALSVHHDNPSTVIKFVHFIITRLRIDEKNGIFLCSSNDSKKPEVKTIASFVDEVVMNQETLEI